MFVVCCLLFVGGCSVFVDCFCVGYYGLLLLLFVVCWCVLRVGDCLVLVVVV